MRPARRCGCWWPTRPRRAAGWSSPRRWRRSRSAPPRPGSTSRPWLRCWCRCRWTGWWPGTSTTRSRWPTSRGRWPRCRPRTPATMTPVSWWTAPKATNCSGTPARSCRTWPAERARRGNTRSGRDLVEEPEHAGEPAVVAGHGDIEADDHRLRAVGGEAPGEPRLPVVAVHRAEQGEAEAGELLLGAGDHGVDGLVPDRLAERVGVARALRPDLLDELAAQHWVGLVPAGDVPLDDLLHGISPWVSRLR